MNEPELLRLYADSDGETHGERIPVSLAPVAYTGNDAPPLNMSEPFPASEARLVRVSRGWAHEGHSPPARFISAVMQGGVTFTTSDGEAHAVGPGQAIWMDYVGAEGVGHDARFDEGEDTIALHVTLSERPSQRHSMTVTAHRSPSRKLQRRPRRHPLSADGQSGRPASRRARSNRSSIAGSL